MKDQGSLGLYAVLGVSLSFNLSVYIMEINLIFAQGIDGAFGLNNQLPWRCPSDLAYFKHLTRGHAVVMGKNTWYSLPQQHRPLKDRANIVVSQEMANQRARPHLYMQDTEQNHPSKEELIITRSLEGAIKKATVLGIEKLFVIGGPTLLQEALPRCEYIYQTVVDYDGPFDVKAPVIPGKGVFSLVTCIPSCYTFAKSERDQFGVRFLTWKRNKAVRLV